MSLAKTQIPGLLTDPATGVVINTKQDELTLYRSQIARARDAADTRKRLESLENEVKLIKKQLAKLLGDKEKDGRNRQSG